MAETWAAARFLHFAAAMAAFGIAAFRHYAFAGAGRTIDAAVRAAFDAALARAMAVAAGLALASALAIIPFTAAEMSGSNAAARDPTIWHAVLFDTQFGRVWCWHCGCAAALMLLSAAPPRPWRTAAASLAALLLLASLGLTGHAAMDMGGGASHEINQTVHLVAGGLWLGGLLPLGMLLRRALRPGGAAYAALAQTALPHFSQIGYAAVALLLITGTVNSLMLVGSLPALFGTPYGRLLAVKIALVLAMVGLALVNRLRFVPRLGTPGSAIAALRALSWSVAAEQAIGIAILA